VKHERRKISAPDGTRLVVEQWAPKGETRFAVCIVHGNSEHIGRYADVAADLGAAGGFVFGMDRRGEGESGGHPGHADSFDTFTADLRHLLLEYTQELPEVPLFLLGHSAGGLVVLLYLLDRGDDVPLRGAIVSNPLLELALKVNPATLFFGKLAASVLPRLGVASNIPPSSISRDSEQVAAYEADTRRVRKVTTRWFVAMTEAAARVQANVRRITTPLLWAIGTGDLICDHTASERAFAKLSDPDANDQTLRVFDGYYHELHNEPAAERAPVLAAYVEWIEARLSGASKPAKLETKERSS
jgi:alpha-beta hydrolase superfamily lysophospholipase